MKLASLILSAMILSSCCGIQGQPSPINLPPGVEYEKIQRKDLSCLSQKVYDTLNTRRAQCESRVKTLENTIKEYNNSIK